MEEASSIKSCELCATKNMQILYLLKNTTMLQKRIVEIGDNSRYTIESKDMFIEGMSEEAIRNFRQY